MWRRGREAFLLCPTHHAKPDAGDSRKRTLRMASFDADAPPPPTARLIPLPRNCARAGTPSDCCLALVLDGVLSADECAGLVARGKDAGPRYVTEARHVVDGVVTYIPIQKPKKYKVSVFEDAALGDDLWARLRARCGASIAAFAERDGWAPARGLNKRMRVLHYSGADQFEPHYDRVVPEEDSDRHSLITVLVYLNDGGADADEGGPEEAGAASFGGGETLFLDYTGRAPAHKVVPKAGRVVLFEHDLYHSGAPLLDAAGHKYVGVPLLLLLYYYVSATAAAITPLLLTHSPRVSLGTSCVPTSCSTSRRPAPAPRRKPRRPRSRRTSPSSRCW